MVGEPEQLRGLALIVARALERALDQLDLEALDGVLEVERQLDAGTVDARGGAAARAVGRGVRARPRPERRRERVEHDLVHLLIGRGAVDATLHHVLQLPDVARPRVADELLARARRE